MNQTEFVALATTYRHSSPEEALRRLGGFAVIDGHLSDVAYDLATSRSVLLRNALWAALGAAMSDSFDQWLRFKLTPFVVGNPSPGH